MREAGRAADPAHLALAEWQALSEAILRGLVHALNNRLTALSAFAELASMGEEEFTAARTLPAELERVQRLGALFRLLATDGEAPEAVELGAVLDDAANLHRHHARVAAVPCEIVRDVPYVAVRSARRPLLRLLVLLLERGQRFAETHARPGTVLRLMVEEPWITLTLDEGTLSPGVLSAAADCGAVAEQAGAAVVIRLPSLQALRQRERAAPAGGRD